MRPAIHLSQVLRASKVACTVVLGVRTQGAWTSIACLLDSKHAAPRFPNILPSRSFYFGEPGNQSGLTSSIFQPRRVDGLQLDRSLCVLGQRIEYVKRVEASIAKFFLYHSIHFIHISVYQVKFTSIDIFSSLIMRFQLATVVALSLANVEALRPRSAAVGALYRGESLSSVASLSPRHGPDGDDEDGMPTPKPAGGAGGKATPPPPPSNPTAGMNMPPPSRRFAHGPDSDRSDSDEAAPSAMRRRHGKTQMAILSVQSTYNE